MKKINKLRKCAVKRCRGIPEISVVGVLLCDHHWDLYCDDETTKNNVRAWLARQNSTGK